MALSDLEETRHVRKVHLDSTMSSTGENNGTPTNPMLSQGSRQMLDLINRLHSTGVQTDIDLPQIAVIGSQSAGKSSLIESISGITLPRAAGTCTRCPTECRLSHSNSPWQCVVSLRFITNERGQALGEARTELFGPTITDKAEVEGRIRRAQRAILNPSKPRSDFLEADEDVANPELSFSNNCVTLQISGPDIADLSFCDLPGLIASVSSSKGNSNDIALVENLVTAYIKKPSCIILLTVACETDFENQGAQTLAKRYDPEGKRTIGVLTKPDRIPTGEEVNWLSFIRNEREPLENNWYCVKQPSSSDLKQKITWQDARRREDEFFSMTAPWSELDTVHQKYLRTANLVERLSSVLSELIIKRLPQIQDELEKAIAETRLALNSLHKEPSNDPLNEIVTLLHIFTNDVAKHVEGVPHKAGLLQAIRPAQERFRRGIRVTAPKFRPYERVYVGHRHLLKPKFLSNEEGNDDDEGSGIDDSPGFIGSARSDDTDDDGDTDDNDDDLTGQGQGGIICIDEVLEMAQDARTRELPGNYPFVVQELYIKEFINKWHLPSQSLVTTVHTLVMEHCKKLVTKHCNHFGQGTLEQRVKAIIQKHVNECLQRAEERIEWQLKLEERPFTLNSHYFSDYKDKFFAYYKGSRRKDEEGDLMELIHNFIKPKPMPVSEGSFGSNNRLYREPSVPGPTGVGKVLAGLAEMGLTQVKAEDIPKLLPPDKMQPALHIMSDVRAYFQVAYKRFSDNICLAIDFELVRGVERNLITALYATLGINGPDGPRICKELAQESPHLADRRADLKGKLQRLLSASSELLLVSV